MKLKILSKYFMLPCDRLCFTLVFLLLVTAAFPIVSHSYLTFAVGTKHDFVDNGFTGGGVCSECHATDGTAGDDRLFKWNSAGSDPGMCMNKCHGAVPALPAEPEWAPVIAAGVTPPKAPHKCVVGRCETCHNGQPRKNCLDCHSGASDSLLCRTPDGPDAGTKRDQSYTTPMFIDTAVDTTIDKFFLRLDGGAPSAGQGSWHRIIYNTGSPNLNLPANNECLKCHGSAADPLHPGDVLHPGVVANRPILVYPDAVGAKPKGAGIVPPQNTNPQVVDAAAWSQYYLEKRQLFCLACHDGRTDGGAVAADISFNSVPVPAVPRHEHAAGAPFTKALPYFAKNGESTATYLANNFFVMSGHGRSDTTDLRRSLPINMTCLGEEPRKAETGFPANADNATTIKPFIGTGCHSAHGSTSLSLLRDNGAAGSVNLGTSIQTAEQMASVVCMGCHNRTDIKAFGNGFHLWLGSGANDMMAHFDSRGTTVGSFNSIFYRDLPDGVNATTEDIPGYAQIMPFFQNRNAFLGSGRLYSGRVFDPEDYVADPSSIGSVINCLTCHDPHGTTDAILDDQATARYIGMVRLPKTDIGYPAEPFSLCAQCHVR